EGDIGGPEPVRLVVRDVEPLLVAEHEVDGAGEVAAQALQLVRAGVDDACGSGHRLGWAKTPAQKRGEIAERHQRVGRRRSMPAVEWELELQRRYLLGWVEFAECGGQGGGEWGPQHGLDRSAQL